VFHIQSSTRREKSFLKISVDDRIIASLYHWLPTSRRSPLNADVTPQEII